MKPRLPSGVSRLPVRVRIAAALESLPERDRQVLVLRLVEGLSPIETAGALKITVRETEQRFTAAMGQLSRGLGLRSSLRRAA